jgi:hypothetical protein
MYKFCLSLALLLGIPTTTFAQSTGGTYTFLAPIGNFITGTIDLKSAGGITTYLQSWFTIAIGIAGVLAVVMIVICGIKLMGTPSASAKSEAKECIRNAIFGLLLAIGSWALLFTINPQLVTSNIIMDVSSAPPPPPIAITGVDQALPKEEGWYFKIQDAAGNKVYKQTSTKSVCSSALDEFQKYGASAPGECEQVTKYPVSGNEASIRADLKASNIYVNKQPCPTPTTPYYSVPGGCTSVSGLPAVAVDVIKSLSSAVGANPPQCTETAAVRGDASCYVTVTGGTEAGHKTHFPNKPNFDLRRTTKATQYLFGNATKKTLSFSGHYRYLWNGFWWTDEGNHWHACKDGDSSWYCREVNRAGQPLKCSVVATGPQVCS